MINGYFRIFIRLGYSFRLAKAGPESPRGSRLGPEGLKTLVGSIFGSMRIPRKQFCISSQFKRPRRQAASDPG